MEKVVAAITQKKLDNLNGFVNLVALDAAVQKNIQQDLLAFRSNFRSFDSLAWVKRLDCQRLA